MSVIVPLSILAGGLGLKQEIDEIGQRKADTAYREAQTAYVNQQAAMAAWQLERARADEMERNASNAALGQFYRSELDSELSDARQPTFGAAPPGVIGATTLPGMPGGAPFTGPQDPGKVTRLQALQNVWGDLTPEAQGLALGYAEREDTKEAFGEAAAEIANGLDFMLQGNPDAQGDVDVMKGTLEGIAALAEENPAAALRELGDFNASVQEWLGTRDAGRQAFMANQGMIEESERVIAELSEARRLVRDPVTRASLDNQISRARGLRSSLQDSEMTSNQFNQHLSDILEPGDRVADMTKAAVAGTEAEYKVWLAGRAKEAGYEGSTTPMPTEAEKEAMWNTIHSRRLRNYGIAPEPESPGTPYTAEGVVKAVQFQGMSKAQAKDAIAQLVSRGLLTVEDAERAADELGLD